MKTSTYVALFVAATVGVAVLIFAGNNCDSSGGSKGGAFSVPSAAAACAQGEDCLPKVQFIDINGTAYTPQSLAGKVVVVNFWATWCGPCQKEIPAFSKVSDKYKDKGVVFLGVMTDQPDSQTLLNFTSDYNMSYPVIRTNADINLAFGYPEALPTTFVYDRGGKRRFMKSGALSESQLESMLAQLAAQK